MKKVAIIPARGGSKRIHQKNIKFFCGQPIIAYSIKLAIRSGIFDEVIVSSDDAQILEIAREYGASTPFIRPRELSTDAMPTLPVIAHAIRELGVCEDAIICCLYPTAPLLEKEYLLMGYESLCAHKHLSYTFGAVEFESSPLRGFYIQDDVLSLLFPQYQMICSQDLQKVYHDAGAFYFGHARSFLQEHEIFAKHSLPIVLPKMLVQDIDTLDDWNLAEIKYQLKHDCNFL